MKKILLALFGLAIVVSTQGESNAQFRQNSLRQNKVRNSFARNKNNSRQNITRQNNSRQNNSRQNTGPPNARTPKVDFRMGHISRVGQGLAVHVRNQGTVASPKARVLVKVYDLQSRTLLQTKILTLGAIGPNQQRRVIFVPNQSTSITVVAKVDPGNQVRESNERNNEIAIRF